jgi:hypothetical protein
LQRALAVQSAAIIERLAAARAATQVPGRAVQPDAAPPDPAGATGASAAAAADEQEAAGSGSPAQPAQPRCRTAWLSVRECGSASAMVIALWGRDRAELIARLDEVTIQPPAGSLLQGPVGDRRAAPPGSTPAAARLEGACLASGQPPATTAGHLVLPAACPPAAVADGGARVALVGSGPAELMALASRATAMLRGSGPAPLRAWPPLAGTRSPTAGNCPAVPGIYLSEGARGRLALVFGGLAWTSAEHVRMLSTSATTIAWARRLGADAQVAAAFGLGEIIGLAWAEAISHDEATRLAALRAAILRPMGGLTSMARVHADRETTGRLLVGTPLVRAVDEGPGQQVVAGPLPSIQALPHRAAGLGVPVELLSASCGLHTHDMWPCVGPMAAIAAGTPIGPLRRRLISSVTGIDFALSGAPADLLARQLERPALLASAITLASADADLVLLATREAALARAVMSCCPVPVLEPPADPAGDPAPEVLAALFAAGVTGGAWPACGLPASAVPALDPDHASAPYPVPHPGQDRVASVTVG